MLLGNSANLLLLKSALLLTICVHFLVLGVIAGGASTVVALDILGSRDRHRGLAITLLDRVAPGPVAAAFPCLTGVLILLGAGYCYPVIAPAGPFWAGTVIPLLAGLSLLVIYRRMLHQGHGRQLRAGCALTGIAMVLFSSFLLCCGSGLLVMPEKWPLLASVPLLFLSWSATARYLEFTCLALAATGAVILLLSERMTGLEETRFARRLGAAMALFFLFTWPPVLLFGLFNQPVIALSGGSWLLAAAGLSLAAILCGILLDVLQEPEKLRPIPILALFLPLFAVWVLADHQARENALDETTVAGLAAPVRVPAPVTAPPAAAGRVAAGKAVFERICSACHLFDEKKVGPPLNTVMPKYRRDPEALKAFIRSPVKRDPAYPAMPKLPLAEAEIDAVAAYLLEKAAP